MKCSRTLLIGPVRFSSFFAHHASSKCSWAMETMTNMEDCFKVQRAAAFPDINIKINYAHEKYVGRVSAK